MTPGEAYELVESALQAPADERAYFIRQALDILPDDHRAREPLQDVLAGDATPEDGLRAAYGALPVAAPDEAVVSGQTIVLQGELCEDVEERVARDDTFDAPGELVEDAIRRRLSRPSHSE